MKIKAYNLIILIFFCLPILVAKAETLSPEAKKTCWDRMEESALSKLIGWGAKVISSDAITLPSGEIALVTYLQTTQQDALFRCVDYTDSSLIPNKQMCWKLLARATARNRKNA
jgi:hypothetical protein